MKVYPKDTMDRLGDDLTELILSFLWFEDKIRLECVSKQWKRCVFQRQFLIEIDYNRDHKNHSSLNGLFRRSDDERQSDEQRLVSIMKKCPKITKVVLGRKAQDFAIGMMNYYYPDVNVNNIEDLLNIDPNVLPPHRKQVFGNDLKYLLNSNRYAFDSQVLLPLGQFCPHIKSLKIRMTYEQDLTFFRMYGHKLEELKLKGPDNSNLVKDCLKFCPNLKKIKFRESSVLLDEDKKFLPKLEVIDSIIIKVVPVWEFPKMTSREFPGISRFFGKTRAGNGKRHIEIFAPKLQRHF